MGVGSRFGTAASNASTSGAVDSPTDVWIHFITLSPREFEDIIVEILDDVPQSILAEQLDSEGPFFEIFKLPAERLLDDVFQQLLPAPAPLKRRTAGNLSHMLPDCRRMGNNFEDTCDRRRVMRFAGSARHGVLTLNGRISHCRKR